MLVDLKGSLQLLEGPSLYFTATWICWEKNADERARKLS